MSAIRAGYKQTEVGVIPEDWADLAFSHLYAESSRNGIYKTSEFHGRGTRIVNMGEMFGFEFISNQEMNRVELTSRELSACVLQDGDLLFGRRSVVPAGAGKCSLVISPSESITFESSIIRVRLDKAKAHSRFYYYFFASPAGRSVVGTIISGTNVKGIRATELRELTIPLPTKAEQEAIAEALSDADALIESLEQLLAKKRHLKQGTMQELLTGKKRLPGFSGEWEVKLLGEVLAICHGKSQHAVEDRNGSYPILATGGQIGTANDYLHDKPSVLIGRKGTIDEPQYMDTPFWSVDTLFYSVIHEPNCAKFLFYRFCLIAWKQHNEASGVPSLNAKTIERIEVAIPQPEEQTAIASILSDIDAEIAALESQLTKTRALKQGMMQKLLTGEIRLI